MRERFKVRPEGFRLNYASPLATGLVFAGLGAFGSQKPTMYHDSTHYRNHGTLTNMNPATDWLWSPELGRWAVYGDNIDNLVIVPGSSVLHPAMYTVLLRVKLQSTRADGSMLLHKGTYPNYAYKMDYYNGSWHFRAYDNIGASIADASPTVGQKLLAMTFDGSTIIPYLNGVAGTPGAATMAGSATDQLGIGAYIPQPTGWPTHGLLSDVCIYQGCRPSVIPVFADPSNVMLEVGGVPLLLPPRRRLWPVAAGPPSFKAAWAARRPRHIMATGVI